LRPGRRVGEQDRWVDLPGTGRHRATRKPWKPGICGMPGIAGMGGKCDLNCSNWDWNWDCSEVQNFGSDICASHADTSGEGCCGFCLFMLGSAIFAYRYGLSRRAFHHGHRRYRMALRRLHDVDHRTVGGRWRRHFPAVRDNSLTIVLYLMGTPQRKRNRQKMKKLAAERKEEIKDDRSVKRESIHPDTPHDPHA
jgi:hypothetical protein